ncbi:cysteine desulfurase [Bombilactobacillus bombi]|uniref:Cysteine desulfurase n=1 Tax=Bombilactobacillus bombi TaxID=1303590 RepID=A0A347SRH6_9LACO|nr:cysteine desulfurase [Bombilactobacillus bombi]AXX64635.1 cysteine desulfurase [Bombilactobacillus bombi]RHW46893.1 cysteine desulfurase [Bombilactobacillus bombi]
MATTATVLGDNHRYQINPKIKVYSLTDVGFQQTKLGNFHLEQPISGNSPYVESYKLKIKIMQNLKDLRIDTTDNSGMHVINIFKLKDNQEVIEQYNYAIKNLLDREILTIV